MVECLLVFPQKSVGVACIAEQEGDRSFVSSFASQGQLRYTFVKARCFGSRSEGRKKVP